MARSGTVAVPNDRGSVGPISNWRLSSRQPEANAAPRSGSAPMRTGHGAWPHTGVASCRAVAARARRTPSS